MEKEFYFDVDGVILDFESGFVDFIRDNYRPDLPQDFQLKYWELSKEFPDIDMGEAWEIFVASDRFSELNLLVSQNTFNGLTNGYPTYLVTNIPQNLVEKRKKNLSRHLLQYSELYCAGHWDFEIKDYPSKSGIIKQLHQKGNHIIFLDDHPTNCREVAEKVPDAHVFLMTRAHNQKEQDDCWVRVANWDELVSRVEKIN
jgi:hypothetical protein